MGDFSDRDHALRIQTENLPEPSTPVRVPSTRSLNSSSRNGSHTSSPIITPSGSTHHLPSTALTPLPSPLVLVSGGGATFPSSLSLENLVLATNPRRKGYGGLGVGSVSGDRRNVTEFTPTNGLGDKSERRASSNLSGRTLTNEGLRREEVYTSRSRQSSIGDDLYDLEWWRTDDDVWKRYQRRYVQIRSLGRGTFSKVILAEPFDPTETLQSSPLPEKLAIKVVNLDATDNAPSDRITSSARRELEILKKINHPSITRLLAYKELPDKYLFGLQFLKGGDLFEFASKHRDLLTPLLVKKIFRELTLAVQYLHESMHVVHRDLKLENILLNYPTEELSHPTNLVSPIISLTDLGLSRPYDPNSPLLTTRCGSTDYAAPEIMLGQPYDGRSTDSWALGVILYCLLEHRLPFDPPPDARRPGKVTHRIAMGQWKWYRLARERRTKSVTEIDVAKDITVLPGGIVGKAEGEGAFIRGGGVWEGGMEIVEGLLRRKSEMRWGVGDILKSSWLQD